MSSRGDGGRWGQNQRGRSRQGHTGPSADTAATHPAAQSGPCSSLGNRGHYRGKRGRGQSYASLKRSVQREKQEPHANQLSTEATTELTFIPKKLMGLVIGKQRESLRKVELESGARLKIIDRKLFINGSSDSQLKARVRLKDIISNYDRRQEKAKRFIYLDTSYLPEDSEFELQPVSPPSPRWLPGDYYQLKLVDVCGVEENNDLENEFAQSRRQSLDDALKEELLAALEKIYQEKEEKELEVDMWCHFGRVYFTGIDEETFVNDGNSLTVDELKIKLRVAHDKNSSCSKDCKQWRTMFQAGLSTALEIRTLESELQRAQLQSGWDWKEDERYDLCFYTPSCQQVRVKVWLVKGNEAAAGSEDGARCYSQSPPEHIPNLLRRVHPDSSKNVSLSESMSEDPSFYLCWRSTTKLTIDVLLPGHRFDCRFIVRTSAKDASANMTAQTRDEIDILQDHLRNMRIEAGQLVCPPALEDFELTFSRRSLRRTYQYTSEGVPCHLDVCKEESQEGPTENGDPLTHIDLHLQCDEWDEDLRGGTWQPRDIISKFPQFLRFVKGVQNNLKLLDRYDDEQ